MKFCCYCGKNIELENGISGKEQTLCKYGSCINAYNNCKYRVKNYLGHKSEKIREFSKVVQGVLDRKLPVIGFDQQLKSMATAFRKHWEFELIEVIKV